MAKIKHITKSRITSSKLPLVIGYFNVVHAMHVRLLNTFRDFNIFTFNDFYPKNKNAIYSFEERITNLEKYRPTNIFVLDLNKYNMTAQEFVDDVLNKIKPTEIVVGEDFKFGLDHKGVDFLKQYFNVVVLNYNKQISTTHIIQHLKNNEIEKANDYLDEPYYYISKWLSGRKLGKQLGFRTINLKVKDNFVLNDGTYVTTVELGRKKYPSVTFVGKSDTTNSNTRTIECHIINKKILPRSMFSPLVKNNVKVSFLKYLRSNQRFADINQLASQIADDKVAAIKYFKENI